MNSPSTSPTYSIYYLQQQTETRTESSATIQSSSVIYLHQQQTESRPISTTTPNSKTSTPDQQKSDDSTDTAITTTTTINSNEHIPRPSTATSTTTLDSNELHPLPPTAATTITSSSSSFSSSSLETLTDAPPLLSPPTSSTPPPLLTPNSPPARHLNPTDIRPHLETIDRTALPPAYRPPPLSRIEAAEILLEICYGQQERSREGTVELRLELQRSALPSSRPVVVQVNDSICGEGAANGGPRGGAVWGSRLRANTKKSLKLSR